MEHGKEKGPSDPLEEKAIDVTASMQGTISFSDPVNLRIQGSFEGKLQAKGQLTVGEKAHVKADIEADRVTIAGKVEGKVMAREFLQVTSTGQCIGEITTSRLIVEEGGILQGKCRVSKGAAAAEEVSGAAPERRQWPRLDLSDRKGRGILIRATLPKGEPISGYVRNISGGGVCVGLPMKGNLPQEFPLRLFFPGRSRPIKATGRMIWSRKGERPSSKWIAAQFSAITPEHQGYIQRYVSESGAVHEEASSLQEKGGR